MTLQAPPNTTGLTDADLAKGEDPLPSSQWAIFFDAVFRGDAGKLWVPTFQGLTTVGVPRVVGRVFEISKYLSYFSVTITPQSGESSSAVAGTTYIDNFPLQMNNNGACLAVSGNLGANAGMCDAAGNRIYPPTWTGVTVPLTIIGIVEAS